jgi:hypothetical protein
MESIRFCDHCGGLLEKGFLFCPYCGRDLTCRISAEKITAGPFRKIEGLARASSFKRLEGCGDALAHMERELDDFLIGKTSSGGPNFGQVPRKTAD